MEPNLPATAPTDTALVEAEQRAPVTPRRPISVAFLPLALVVFIVIAFVMAAWTFLAATT
jgi:hypothetical protein